MCKSIQLVLQSKLLFYEQVFNDHISQHFADDWRKI